MQNITSYFFLFFFSSGWSMTHFMRFTKEYRSIPHYKWFLVFINILFFFFLPVCNCREKHESYWRCRKSHSPHLLWCLMDQFMCPSETALLCCSEVHFITKPWTLKPVKSSHTFLLSPLRSLCAQMKLFITL